MDSAQSLQPALSLSLSALARSKSKTIQMNSIECDERKNETMKCANRVY